MTSKSKRPTAMETDERYINIIHVTAIMGRHTKLEKELINKKKAVEKIEAEIAEIKKEMNALDTIFKRYELAKKVM